MLEPIVLTGALDQYAAEEFRLQAIPLLQAEGDAVLDLSDVERMHGGFLQVLLVLSRELQAKGRQVVLQGLGEQIREIFRISGTESLFTFSGGAQ